MPDAATHIALAQRNQLCLDYLRPKISDYPEWVVVVAFYRALHLVEAVFASLPTPFHSPDHSDRRVKLFSDNRFKNLREHYRPIERASKVARYLADGSNSYSSFSAYLSATQVEHQILNHRLRQVQASAENLLGYKISVATSPPPVATASTGTGS